MPKNRKTNDDMPDSVSRGCLPYTDCTVYTWYQCDAQYPTVRRTFRFEVHGSVESGTYPTLLQRFRFMKVLTVRMEETAVIRGTYAHFDLS